MIAANMTVHDPMQILCPSLIHRVTKHTSPNSVIPHNVIENCLIAGAFLVVLLIS